MYGYIYKITLPKGTFNKDYDVWYYGQKTGEFDENYWGSGTLISKYFKSFGYKSNNCKPNEFTSKLKREIICYCNTVEELNNKEYEIIHPELNNKNCLNLCEGGRQPIPSEKLKERISTATKKAIWTDDVRQKYLKSLETRFTEETRKKMSEAAKTNKNYIKMNEKNRQKNIEQWNDPETHEKRRAMIAKKLGKKVICIETGIIYDSCRDAERKTGISHIIDVAKGKRATAGGFHWIFC